MLDDHFDERGGRQVVLAQLVEQQHVGPQIRVLGAGFAQRVEIALSGDVIDFFGGFGPHALGQPRHTLEGGHVQRVDRQPHERHHVLDVYGFRIAQPAVFAELDAAFGECDLKVVGLVARAEQHGDFLRLIAVKKLFHARRHHIGLRQVAHGADEAHAGRFGRVFLGREQVFAETLGGRGQHRVGDVEHGLCGAVVLLKPDDPRSGEQLGEVEDVADVRAPEGVDGLGVVAHGHDVARFPGEEPHQPGLNAVGVLILVHHDVAVAFPEPLGKPFAPRLGIAFKQILKLEQQVVVVEQPVLAAVAPVCLSDAFQRIGVGQQVLRVALEHVADGNFLVPGFAEEADDGLRLGERAVALADFEPFLALLDGGGAVRRVHDGDRAFGPCGPVLAQHREREAVERAAVDAADAVAEQIRGPEQHFAAGLAGKREQQHVACRDALFRQPGQTVDDCAGLAAPRARDDQNRAVRRGHGFELGRVECRNVYHWNSVGRGCLRLSGRRPDPCLPAGRGNRFACDARKVRKPA